MPETATPADGAATAAYVYGVVPAAASPDLFAGVSGIAPGSCVELVVGGPLAAVVTDVAPAEFNERALEERLGDPGWLAEKARAHERVLERALAGGAVVPFRFGTIVRDRADVGRLLAERAQPLRDALERVAGRVELGVKAIAPPDLAERVRAGSAEARRLEEQLDGAAAGRRYLLEKQLGQAVAREAADLRARIAAESHATLSSLAVAAVANPPQRPELGGFEGDMLLNGAYLVAREGEAGFLAAVERLQERWREHAIRFEATGPWPPFNFVAGEAR